MPRRENFHSAEAHEILGSIPSWIVRWGITVVFTIFIGIVIGCYFIKYPKIVVGKVVITTLNPPSNLTARYTGLLDSVYVANGEQVEQGQLLMLLATPAKYCDIKAIEQNISDSYNSSFHNMVHCEWLNCKYTLGDIQSAYADFQRQSLSYCHYLEIGHIDKKRDLLTTQIGKSYEYYTKLKSQQGLIDDELRYEQINLNRDSMLYVDGIISTADYETSTRNLLSKKGVQVGFDASLTNTELSIVQTEQQLIELSIQKDNEIAEYERTLSQLRQQVLSQISQWKEQYAIIAPSDGCVSLLNHWNRNQHVNVGDVLASVVPNTDAKVIGRIHVPSAGFGKVAAGQVVNIKLNGFPYMEFGVLRGEINSISAIPEQSQVDQGITYIAEIIFPKGLETTYKRRLPLIQQMDGTGEVVTEDMRLIEQFIQPIVSLFVN